jgi:uncharacterized protein (DUF2147 family)
MTRELIATLLISFSATFAFADDPIVGKWKTELGDIAAIAPCGGGYCITLQSGKHAGMQIGNFKGKGGTYTGKITDPDTNKTYDGSMTVTGSALKMKGCVLKVVCQSQTWPRV